MSQEKQSGYKLKVLDCFSSPELVVIVESQYVLNMWPNSLFLVRAHTFLLAVSWMESSLRNIGTVRELYLLLAILSRDYDNYAWRCVGCYNTL